MSQRDIWAKLRQMNRLEVALDGALGCAVVYSVFGLLAPSLAVPGIGLESWLILPGLYYAAELALGGIVVGAVMGALFRFT
jgi:hypothetical protein